MTDHLSKQARSLNMAKIKSKDTLPEIKVRKLLYSMGHRFRIHGSALPGKPDIVLRQHNSVILVHGCFWHLHKGCREGVFPKTRRSFWFEKLTKNKARDKKVIKSLRRNGWAVLRLWECEIEKDLTKVESKIKALLS